MTVAQAATITRLGSGGCHVQMLSKLYFDFMKSPKELSLHIFKGCSMFPKISWESSSLSLISFEIAWIINIITF